MRFSHANAAYRGISINPDGIYIKALPGSHLDDPA
jgi:hypothetical protein